MLRDHLCQTVPCHWDHTVGDNAPVLRNGYIGGAGSYIHKRNIQHTVHLRNRNLNRRYGLQRQIHHIQSCQIYCPVQTVYHILRKKSSDDIRPDRPGPVSFQIPHSVAIHVVTHNRIAHTVEFHIRVIAVQELFISFLNSQRVQCIDVLSADFSVTFQIRINPDRHRTQHTTGRRDTDIFQRPADPLLQFRLNVIDRRSHFIDIMDLSIQHGPRSMFSDALRDYMEFLSYTIAYSTDHTSRSDIQSKY